MPPRPLPSVEPLVHIVDDAVPPALFDDAHRRLIEIGAAATYWKTFWFPWGEPKNIAESLALQLRRHIPDAEKIVGVEWWIGRMSTARVTLDFHHDRDLKLFEATGRLRFPHWSSVLFFNAVRGGSLFITDQQLRRRGDQYRLSPAEPDRFATARPAANRFVRFPGELLHGVLDANDQVPQRRLPPSAGDLRLSMVFNWWKRPPQDVPCWTGRTYRRLALKR